MNSLRSLSLNPSIFDFSWSIAAIRYGIILLTALCVPHLRGGLFPFAADYSFPTISVGLIFTFGLVICSSSWIITNVYRPRIFDNSQIDPKGILIFFGVNLLSTALVYTVMHLIFFGSIGSSQFFINNLVMCFAIIIIENLAFLLYGTIRYQSQTEHDIRRTSFLIPTGTKSIKLDFSEVSHACLDNGIVTIFTIDNQRINSQYNTLEQLEAELPPCDFYRANRQFILSRQSIKHVVKDKNRKLVVQINGQVPAKNINISRYKSKEIIDWINMSSQA